MSTRAQPWRAFTLGELAVALAVAAAMVAFLLARFDEYRGRTETVAVRHMVTALELALRVEAARAGGGERLRALAEANPMDLLAPLPVNYLGEREDLQPSTLPDGSWVFDRRDRMLVYRTFSSKNFTFSESRLLKFKVEFVGTPEAHESIAAGGSGAGLVLKPIDAHEPN